MKTARESQIDKFRRAARELECDESDDALDRSLGRLDLTAKRVDHTKREDESR